MSTQLPKLDFHFVEKVFPIPPMSTKMKLFFNFFFFEKIFLPEKFETENWLELTFCFCDEMSAETTIKLFTPVI
jgi:hypothetical protein